MRLTIVINSLDQLSIGGILVIPMGRDKTSQFIYRITRQEDGYQCEQLMPVRFVPLLPNIARNEPVQEEHADPFVLADSFVFQG